MPNLPLPWHQSQWQHISMSRKNDRLPHALLITGQVGLGKAQFAELLAQALLCKSPDGNGLACNNCQPCSLYSAQTHPDFFHLVPEKVGLQIKIDAIRNLCQKLTLTAQLSGCIVALIQPADNLNPAAANSLLKTLEEPNKATVLLLVSDRPSELPATIVSRCQTLRFFPPSREFGLEWLVKHTQCEDPSLALALTSGAPCSAAALINTEGLTLRSKLFKAFFAMVHNNADPIQVAEDFAKHPLPEALTYLLSWTDDMIKIKFATYEFLVNQDLKKPLQALAERLDLIKLLEHNDQLITAIRLCASQVNPQAILENILLHWVILDK